jgi:hypothetical protein
VAPSKKLVKPLAFVGALGTIVSIWWFALKPRFKERRARRGGGGNSGGASNNSGGE